MSFTLTIILFEYLECSYWFCLMFLLANYNTYINPKHILSVSPNRLHLYAIFSCLIQSYWMASMVNFTSSGTINFCCSKFWVLFWGADDIHQSFQTLVLGLVDADIPHDRSKVLPDIWMQKFSASLLSSLETFSSSICVSWFFPSLLRLPRKPLQVPLQGLWRSLCIFSSTFAVDGYWMLWIPSSIPSFSVTEIIHLNIPRCEWMWAVGSRACVFKSEHVLGN